MTIVDSCIILDLAANDQFTAPARAALERRLSSGRLYAPDIVFAEVSYGYDNTEHVKELFAALGIEVIHLNTVALHRAARAFRTFKEQNRAAADRDRLAKRILPDFLIGAVAEVEGVALLTRDTKRNWTRFFPSLQLVIP